MKTLRLILGDQLNQKHSWYEGNQEDYVYCIFEMEQETNYVVHHIQKVVGFFAAMRAFATYLKEKGCTVVYYTISSKNNTQSLTENLQQLIDKHTITHFEYQLPDEFRLDTQLKEFSQTLTISTKVYCTEHFYTTRTELSDFFEGKKQFLMESFYRYMRKKHDVLLENGKPEGGKWNYDHSNRKKWKEALFVPSFLSFNTDVSDIVHEIEGRSITTIGTIDKNSFEYPINRKQALQQLTYFCENLLPHFGDYQDAMHTHQVYLYHSRLSFAMNVKLLSPKEIVEEVIDAYQKDDAITISQAEGFVRQVIGWREYMRGMYWNAMPIYKEKNYLQNNTPLPKFFWTANTKMNCLQHSIQNSLDNGYAHHIQRLMITGNYLLLTQTHPDEVDKWYLGVYIDAVEWVQLTNTRGMSQYADGGTVATKPYVSSASYIHKMSNYCESCHYNKKTKTEKDSCPFNSLYWNFLDDKRTYLQDNRRMKMMYRLLDKMDQDTLIKIKEKATHIITHKDAY